MILEAKNVYKTYGNKWNKQEVLKGIDLNVEKGEFTSIMGPSGSGKTTLLNVLSSIDRPSRGSIEIEGKALTKMKDKQLAEFRKRHLGFIFQEYHLLDTLTVKENILLPLSVKKVSKREADEKFHAVAEELGIMIFRTSIRMKYPAGRSSGHRQRGRLSMNRVLFLPTNQQVRSIQSRHPTF